MRDAFVNKLTQLAETDKKIFFITGDLGFGVFDNFSEKFPEQYLNVGVAEQNMIGVGTGLALEGRSVFVYSIANFSTLRCLEQIRNDAAYHEANITIVASGGGFTYGALGMSHHATEDIAIMRSLPNIKVEAPCTAWEAYCATEELAKSSGVGYLRIEKGGQTSPPYKDSNFQLGKSIMYREGDDVTLMAAGSVIEDCLLAAKQLEKKAISTRVLSMHSLKPLDEGAIKLASNETKLIVTVEEHNRIGGLGSAVSEVITDQNLDTNLLKICINDTYSSIVGSQDYLKKFYKLDKDSIEQIVLKRVKDL